jgi:hypothetical protein
VLHNLVLLGRGEGGGGRGGQCGGSKNSMEATWAALGKGAEVLCMELLCSCQWIGSGAWDDVLCCTQSYRSAYKAPSPKQVVVHMQTRDSCCSVAAAPAMLCLPPDTQVVTHISYRWLQQHQWPRQAVS